MKYCVEWKKMLSIKNEVDELIVIYNPYDSSLVDFLKQHSNQRIIIKIENEPLDNDIDLFASIKEEYSDVNFTLLLNNYNEDIIEKIKNKNLSFFFETRVSDWDTFLSFVKIGVSDIYIAEDLGFEIDKVSKIAHENNVQIRVFPNICQTKWKEFIPSLKTFFIRPEDIKFYEDYVDVCEIFGSKEFQETIYKIYSKDKEWFGLLKEIIIGFDSDLDSRFILPRFAEKRIRCNRECLKGGKCEMCNRIEELSKSLEKSEMYIKQRKEKNENGERSNSETRNNE